jgi:hypothetical protein
MELGLTPSSENFKEIAQIILAQKSFHLQCRPYGGLDESLSNLTKRDLVSTVWPWERLSVR